MPVKNTKFTPGDKVSAADRAVKIIDKMTGLDFIAFFIARETRPLFLLLPIWLHWSYFMRIASAGSQIRSGDSAQ